MNGDDHLLLVFVSLMFVCLGVLHLIEAWKTRRLKKGMNLIIRDLKNKAATQRDAEKRNKLTAATSASLANMRNRLVAAEATKAANDSKLEQPPDRLLLAAGADGTAYACRVTRGICGKLFDKK
jgi:hypothetical protein